MALNTPPKKNEEAQVGIGTMIVFIATVLVAAVAAGVLIDTGGKLQERSARTGQEATQKVASNVDIETIIGKRDNSTNSGLQTMEVYVKLSPGALEVDLSQMKVQLINATLLQTFGYVDGTPGASEFNATAMRDPDGSFTGTNPVMTAGDFVKITIDLNANSLEFTPRTELQILLIPEVGNTVHTGLQTPNSYGTKLILELA